MAKPSVPLGMKSPYFYAPWKWVVGLALLPGRHRGAPAVQLAWSRCWHASSNPRPALRRSPTRNASCIKFKAIKKHGYVNLNIGFLCTLPQNLVPVAFWAIPGKLAFVQLALASLPSSEQTAPAWRVAASASVAWVLQARPPLPKCPHLKSAWKQSVMHRQHLETPWNEPTSSECKAELSCFNCDGFCGLDAWELTKMSKMYLHGDSWENKEENASLAVSFCGSLVHTTSLHRPILHVQP